MRSMAFFCVGSVNRTYVGRNENWSFGVYCGSFALVTSFLPVLMVRTVVRLLIGLTVFVLARPLPIYPLLAVGALLKKSGGSC